MTSKPIILRPIMNRPLRLARVYGFLLGGKDGLHNKLIDEYNALVRIWNRAVPDLNAGMRDVGRR